MKSQAAASFGRWRKKSVVVESRKTWEGRSLTKCAVSEGHTHLTSLCVPGRASVTDCHSSLILSRFISFAVIIVIIVMPVVNSCLVFSFLLWQLLLTLFVAFVVLSHTHHCHRSLGNETGITTGIELRPEKRREGLLEKRGKERRERIHFVFIQRHSLLCYLRVSLDRMRMRHMFTNCTCKLIGKCALVLYLPKSLLSQSLLKLLQQTRNKSHDWLMTTSFLHSFCLFPTRDSSQESSRDEMRWENKTGVRLSNECRLRSFSVKTCFHVRKIWKLLQFYLQPTLSWQTRREETWHDIICWGISPNLSPDKLILIRVCILWGQKSETINDKKLKFKAEVTDTGYRYEVQKETRVDEGVTESDDNLIGVVSQEKKRQSVEFIRCSSISLVCVCLSSSSPLMPESLSLSATTVVIQIQVPRHLLSRSFRPFFSWIRCRLQCLHLHTSFSLHSLRLRFLLLPPCLVCLLLLPDSLLFLLTGDELIHDHQDQIKGGRKTLPVTWHGQRKQQQEQQQ